MNATTEKVRNLKDYLKGAGYPVMDWLCLETWEGNELVSIKIWESDAKSVNVEALKDEVNAWIRDCWTPRKVYWHNGPRWMDLYIGFKY